MANIYVRSTDGDDVSDGLSWANAKATLAGALAIASGADTIWVSQAHAETAAGAKAHTFPGLTASATCMVLCGDDAAEPPTALATTATITTTGNNAITFPSGYGYVYGITFNSGTGSSSAADMAFGSSAAGSGIVFQTCVFKMISTSSSSPFLFGPTGSNSVDDVYLEFLDCTFSFGSTGQALRLNNGIIIFRNLALNASGSIPTNLFDNLSGASNAVRLLVESSDLSARAFTNLFSLGGATNSIYVIRNCKLPASITLSNAIVNLPGMVSIHMENCDNADTNYRMEKRVNGGRILSETTIVRTGGASDGTTPLSWRMVGVSASNERQRFFLPLASPEIVQWNEVTGSAITVTVEIVNDGTTLQDDEVWLEVCYLGTSGVPLATCIRDRMTNILSTPADQTSSSEAWTTTGLTTPVKQKLSVTFTPQEKGFIHAKVMLNKIDTTIYVDPLLMVS